ncbi:MAG: formate/nitrite transporter family protein [Candidatus Hodarchaeales archaeon]|jgi:formate/nitrite transporter
MPIKSPVEISRSMADSIAVKKATMSVDRLLILGIPAGVYIGFGGILMTTAKVETAQYLGTGITNIIGGAAFSVGLMLVVIGGAELFTGNCLISMGFLCRKISIIGLFKNWSVVYIGNVIGSLLLVVLMFFSGLYGNPDNLTSLGSLGVSISSGKASLGVNYPSGWIMAFSRGILCNWLVCLAVWLAFSSNTTTGKIFSCFFPIMAFVASGFEHSIANWYLIPIGFLLDPSMSLYGTIMIIIIVTLGNIIGGAFFVGFLYWYVYLRST